MSLRVSVLDDYQGVAQGSAPWASLGTDVECAFVHEHLDEQALLERVADSDVLVCMRERTPLPRRVLERLPRLRLVVTTGMRNAAIDVTGARQLGVEVRGTESLPNPTAELTWALIHAITRRVENEDRAVRAGRWQTRVGDDLTGRTLGVVGLGRLGSRVARVAVAFEMSVLAWSLHLTLERAYPHQARYVPLAELLSASDIVTIHLVLGEGTRGVIGADELARMKPSAWLVNTSRGPVVDESALLAALRRRSIAGAALDVYGTEPLPPAHPLLALDNVLLSPHVGYVTHDSYALFYRQAVEDIATWRQGEVLRVL